MTTPGHTSAVGEADGLGLGVGDGAGADVVGCGDGEADRGTRALDGLGLAEPCGCRAGMRLGETAGLVVARAAAVMRCLASLRAVP